MFGQHGVEFFQAGFAGLLLSDFFCGCKNHVAGMAHIRIDFQLKARAENEQARNRDIFGVN